MSAYVAARGVCMQPCKHKKIGIPISFCYVRYLSKGTLITCNLLTVIENSSRKSNETLECVIVYPEIIL